MKERFKQNHVTPEKIKGRSVDISSFNHNLKTKTLVNSFPFIYLSLSLSLVIWLGKEGLLCLCFMMGVDFTVAV